MSSDLNPGKALIFRIMHRDNLPWAFANGLHSRSSDKHDPNYVNIGNVDLIDKRRHRVVPIPPGGTLSDYIPFYFTPYSPMLYNIKTGRGVPKRANEEIVIAVSSLHRLKKDERAFVFSDRHAYLNAAQFSSDVARLDLIDWKILQRRDFQRDASDKFERYQAEALIHRHLPMEGLIGMICYNDSVGGTTTELVKRHGLNLQIAVKPGFYF
jgi:ssDNA thymidine ADP-ribosyltransferase, DarT